MRTTLDIDDEALQRAMQFCEGRTPSEVVNEALRLFVRSHNHQALRGLQGSIEWVGDLDDLRERQ